MEKKAACYYGGLTAQRISRKRLVCSQMVLGEGSCGRVYSGTYGGQSVAVKVVKLDCKLADDAHKTQQLYQEIQLGRCMIHPNLIKYYGICIDTSASVHGTDMYIVMELVGTGSLRQRLDDVIALPVAPKLGVARGICDGLSYLHLHGYASPAYMSPVCHAHYTRIFVGFYCPLSLSYNTPL